MTRGPNPEPWSFSEAQAASDTAREGQDNAAAAYETAAEEAAEKERDYRQALAAKIVELRADWPATTCENMAKGDEHIALLRYERDVALGKRKAAAQLTWAASADRKDTLAFIEWSQRAPQ